MTYEQNGKRRVRMRLIWAMVLVLPFLVFGIYQMITCPDERIQRDVQKLFIEIQPMPGSEPVRLQPISIYKACQATIGNQYSVKATDEEVRQYFDAELARHGWAFQKEEKVLIWGKDYGGKEFFYCRGEYIASIYTRGQEVAESGWSYDFGIEWAGHNCESSQR